MTTYQKPPELHGGLRLHQNENTAGCSPRVLEALRNLGRDHAGDARGLPVESQQPDGSFNAA